MSPQPSIPKSVFYALLAIGLAVLAGDFLLIYLPLSGWILQAIFVGVYFEYLGVKRTILIVAIMEVFFLASYGGSVAVAAVVGLFGAQYVLPVLVFLYLIVVLTVLLLGFLANYLFHKARLFSRISRTDRHQQRNRKSNTNPPGVLGN